MEKNTSRRAATTHKPPSPSSRRAVASVVAAGSERRAAMPLSYFLLGFIALLTATVASAALVLDYFDAANLPGCGADGGCAEATNSAWGKVPGWGLPVSAVGLAYFAALLLGWLFSAGRVGWSLRGLIWLAGFLSLVYLAVMWFHGWLCPYCLTTHVANLALVFATERSFRPLRMFTTPTLATAGVFAVSLATLGGLDFSHRRQLDAVAEQLRRSSAEEIIQRSKQTPATAPEVAAPNERGTPLGEHATTQPANRTLGNATGATPVPQQATGVMGAPQKELQPQVQTPPQQRLFTGRYRMGPEKAPIRIVMFTDYQCPDCRIRERELAELMQSRQDMSVSIKHFPFCAACNPGVPDLHKNACWAARAAEAAGILGGPEAFWKMHQWLFARQGKFETKEQLAEGIRAAGLEVEPFVQLMQNGKLPLEHIAADIAEAKALGIDRTPMIFVNGVELKGWQAPRALVTTVEQVAAANPPAAGPEVDQPLTAADRFVALWRDASPRTLPDDPSALSFGEAGSGPEIVLWSDYEEPETRAADRIIREFVASQSAAGRGGRYTFRHFPFAHRCNAVVAKEKGDPHKAACRMAAAAEAGGAIGDVEARRKLHVWLMQTGAAYTDEKLRSATPELGVDAEKLLAQMDVPATAAAIQQDVRAAQDVGLQSIPWLFVNGKLVTRASYEGQSVLPRVLEEAARP